MSRAELLHAIARAIYCARSPLEQRESAGKRFDTVEHLSSPAHADAVALAGEVVPVVEAEMDARYDKYARAAQRADVSVLATTEAERLGGTML